MRANADVMRWLGALFFTLSSVTSLGCASRQAPPARAPAEVPGEAAPHAARRPASNAPEARASNAPARGAPFQVGVASWYGRAFAGRKTASGERFDPGLFTAAHRKLPFGTWVEVRRVDNGRTVRVRINDRGPNGRSKSRIIDLSERAAEKLDLVRAGVGRVELRIVDGG